MRWLLASLLLFACLGAGAARGEGLGGTPIAVCAIRDAPGLTATSIFARAARLPCTTRQSALGPGNGWVLSAPLSAAALAPHGTSVRFASTWQDATTLHVLYADGAIRRIGFTSATAADRLLLGATFSLPLPHHDAAPVRLLWHVRGAANLRGLILGPTLAGHGSTANREVLLAALYGAFGGMGLALLIYNLALWGALRQRFQPAYCLLLLMLVGYAGSSSGALSQLVPTLDNNDRLRINVVLLAASASAAVLFARSFFERAVFAGWLGRASTGVIALLMGCAIACAAFAPAWIGPIDRLLAGAYVLLMLLVPAMLWRAWRVRSNYLWLFALAWGAPVLLASLRIAQALDLVAWRFWIDQSTVVSMALEALISSLAVAYRIKLLARDRDIARAQESAARHLADIDPLTGILNRRAFLDRAIGRHGDQTLLLLDLDHFKRINDTLGHDGGDEVLRAVARALAAATSPAALVARIGGEEFAIVAPTGDAPHPGALLDRIRAVVLPLDLAVTASIGSCTGPLLREADWKSLYRRADEALFAAKAAGRDRVREARPTALAA